MIVKLIRDDTRGSALIEFTVTVPFFLLLMFGLVQAGLLLYTQSGLQHGVERAARCASVNYSAKQIGLTESCFTASCSETPDKAFNDIACITQYAVQNSFGAALSAATFNVELPPIAGGTGKCGPAVGYVVTASLPFDLIHYIFSKTLTATSCFPINTTSG
jgi:Flp pilus assembly protein TadG